MKALPVIFAIAWVVLFFVSGLYDLLAYIGVIHAPTFSSIIIAWSMQNRTLAILLGEFAINLVFVLFLHLLGLF